MGGCGSSVEDKKGQDQDHTDGTEHKEEAKEKDALSPRLIAVQQADSSEDAAADEYPKSKTKTQCNVNVGLANKLVTQDARPQSNTIDTMEHRDELLTSTFNRHENGAQGRLSQSHRMEDRSQISNRNEDAGTVNLKLQIQELRIERNEMFKFNKDLVTKNEDLSNTLIQKEKEVDDLRTRLSRVASERLTDNNPNVADLSDRNRPTKIADRYTEVYSNEWSDAYEDLVKTGNRTEQEVIQILLEFIENIYKLCLGISMENANTLSTYILLFTGHTQKSTNLSSALKPFKDERKRTYKAFLPTLYMETNNMRDLKLVKKSERTTNVQKYLDIATELCWLMCIQDPPVHLHTDCKHGHKFDEDSFSAYTVRGTKVDYLVWPALLLHKDGPILKKGVAQPKATKDKKQNR